MKNKLLIFESSVAIAILSTHHLPVTFIKCKECYLEIAPLKRIKQPAYSIVCHSKHDSKTQNPRSLLPNPLWHDCHSARVTRVRRSEHCLACLVIILLRHYNSASGGERIILGELFEDFTQSLDYITNTEHRVLCVNITGGPNIFIADHIASLTATDMLKCC